MTILEVINLSKYFGGVRAVDGVSFKVRRNEILGIIGPNGAGKTTLFNLISGYLKPDSGEVIFEGEKITGLEPYKICKKGIVRTFQIPRPFEECTVFENVLVAASFGKNLKWKEAKLAAEDLIRYFELDNKRNALAKELTAFEKRKLEMARALATKPKLLLLDEALAGLNPSEVEKYVSLVKKVHEERDLTIMIVEHNLRAVMSISHRVICMNFGKIIAEGSPEEITKNEEVCKIYLGEEYEVARS